MDNRQDNKPNNIDALMLQIQSMNDVLNNVGAYVFTKDTQGKYIYVNQQVLTLFDITNEEIIGKDDSDFFDLEKSDELRINDIKVMKEQITLESEESNVIKATGEIRIYNTIKRPLINNQGETVGMCGISTDITQQKKLEAENKEQKQLLDVILDNVDAYIYMKDSERHFKYVNSKVADLLGDCAENIIGRKDSDVIPAESADHFWQSDKLVFESNKKQVIDEVITDQNGVDRHYISVKIPYQFDDKTKTLIGFSSDVTELYQLKESFEKQANTDSLTGLFNRRYFFENANREFKRARRHDKSLAVISLDVDHFKSINDSFGHPIGDQVLIEIANHIIPLIREEDIFSRIGGEEFSILLPETSAESARLAAERIHYLLDSQPITLNDDIKLDVKVSVGVSIISANDECFQALYARSDKALYLAKSIGRNQVQMLE
jgi:diguanylate cyclase (GGDEF)-like protein/PAS domain S-box-containing protein